MSAPTPLNLIAELTYRCPLQCPYCSNPVDLASHREALSANDWGRVFDQSSALGVVHVGLTGGEPSLRQDLEEIVSRAVDADLYPHLVTAGLPLSPERLRDMARLGLRSIQVSIQHSEPESSDRIAGAKSFENKIAICESARELGLALTINCVLHRHNLDSLTGLIDLATRLKADRLELANSQYHGWALLNRAALMPTRQQLSESRRLVQAAREKSGGPELIFVLPDYFSGRPKPCMGGWGQIAFVVDPGGRLLPCHDAGEIPFLEFWNVGEKSVEECWSDSPGMQAYRGTEWMSEPCRTCPEREKDFGGCRCQAFKILQDATLTDPACDKSPSHSRIVNARSETRESWQPRRMTSGGQRNA